MAKKIKTPPKPKKTDSEAPSSLTLRVEDAEGNCWGLMLASDKHFATGGVGFYATGKLVNPKNGEHYQLGCSISLIGSKP